MLEYIVKVFFTTFILIIMLAIAVLYIGWPFYIVIYSGCSKWWFAVLPFEILLPVIAGIETSNFDKKNK